MVIGLRQNAAQRVIDCNLPARRRKDQRNKHDCEHRSLHLSRIGELYWNCPRYCLTSMRSLRRVRERNGAVRVHARERKRDALPKPARGTRSSSIQRPIKDSREGVENIAPYSVFNRLQGRYWNYAEVNSVMGNGMPSPRPNRLKGPLAENLRAV